MGGSQEAACQIENQPITTKLRESRVHFFQYSSYGHHDFDDGDSIAEGIGQTRITENVAKAQIDTAYRLHDRHMMAILKHLINEEGLFLGASSGINVGGAVKVALEGGPGQTIVTILCDTAQKYMSRLFDQDWLTENDLPPEDLSIQAMIEEMKAEL